MIYVKNCIAGEAAVINERYVREITEKCATERGGTCAGKCSFHVGGEIALCVIAKSAEELIFAVATAEEYGEKYVVLGNMTNILPPDALYDGTVIVTSQMCNITAGNDRFKADAGFSLTKLSVLARDAGLSGLEFAYGIPGSVGGAIYMNAGAYGGNMADIVTEVTAYSPKEKRIKVYSNAGCGFGYRESVFKSNGEIIISAEMKLTPEDAERISSDCERNMAARREKQPLDKPSAGSTFRRPEGYYAGALIEQAGLKGFSIGGASVSEKHAGFVINAGGASSADISMLISEIKKRVYEFSGVMLEEEIIYIK